MAKKQKTEGSLAVDENTNHVIVIPAKATPEGIKLRVAAYARVSTSSEDQLNSFAAQSKYYTDLIKSQPKWKMVDLYSDAGVTGTSAEKREDFQRLIADCRKGLIDRILVKSISRFARNTKECLQIIRELKLIGVSVYFEEQKIDTEKMTGELLTAVFAAIAQKESESISANMRWSYQHRMESGTYLPSHQTFGYYISNGAIEIDEAKASVVCQIYDDYLAGKNIVEIAEELQKQQSYRPELQNYSWNIRAIVRILKNEKYTGNSLWQKIYSTESLPVRQLPNRGEKPQFYAENTHKGIIDQDTFELVQERMKQHDHRSGNDPNPDAVSIQRRMICHHCGAGFRHKEVRGKRYYVCKTHDHDASHCPITPIPEKQIEAAFTRLCHKLKQKENDVLLQLLQNLEIIREHRMLWSIDVIEVNKQISDIMNQNQTLTLLKRQGLVDPDIFISQSNDLAEQLRKAKQKKERILSTEQDNSIPKTTELIEILDGTAVSYTKFDKELFEEIIDTIIVLDNAYLRFRLTNGLELAECIERKVRL